MTTALKTLLRATLLSCLCLAAQSPDNPSADQLRSALEAELIAAKGVAGHDIDVALADGIVTLDGEVETLLAKERAVRIAGMLRGVRSVVDHLTVTPVWTTDERIRHDVIAAMRNDIVTDSWEIGVRVTNGTVILLGNVDSYPEREFAVTLAKRVRGVREVVNAIDVELDADRTDAEILAEIEKRLAWNARLDGRTIEVIVDDGRASLSGTVASVRERVIARSLAWVAGVRLVDDDLRIRPTPDGRLQASPNWQDVDDDAIRQAVDDAFLYDPRVASFDPEVSVDDGVVTLSGTVPSLEARRSAVEDAANTLGVRKVRNDIEVRPPRLIPDDQVAARLQEALARDVLVLDEDVAVTVTHGVARIEGEVSAFVAREQIEAVATGIIGVVDVDNRLEVGSGDGNTDRLDVAAREAGDR